MGIYDRPYLHDEEHSSGWAGGRSVVVNLIIINVVIWVLGDVFDTPLNSWLELKSNLVQQPWQVYQLLTYGFAHQGVFHILFNMLFLFFFGRELEDIYGKAEFLRIYLVSIVLAGIVWVVFTAPTQSADEPPARVLGASGGVMCVVMLFVMHFPRRLIYIWGVLPVPAWALGAFFVVGDLLGMAQARQPGQVGVANVAHLAGAAFGFLYFRMKWNLGRLVPSGLGDLKRTLLRPKLRIHDPDRESRDLSRQVDAILEKISREGEASLSKKERRTLEEASRRYQRRKQ